MEVNLMGEIPSTEGVPFNIMEEDKFLHDFVEAILEIDLQEWGIESHKFIENHPKKPSIWEILNTPIHLLW